MRSPTKRLLLVILIVTATTQVALAGLLGPFSFSFANSFMNSVFWLPFRMGGCS